MKKSGSHSAQTQPELRTPPSPEGKTRELVRDPLNFFLTMTREDSDPDLIASLRRRKYHPEEEERMKPLAAVFFRIDRELPLVGSGED